MHGSSSQDDLPSSQNVQSTQAILQAETNTNTKTLAQLVSQQQITIQLLQKERQEAKKEHQELVKLISNLSDQVKKLESKLQPQTTTLQRQPQNWASVAAQGAFQTPPTYNRQPGNNPTTILIDVPPPAPDQTPANGFTRNLPTPTAVNLISRALKSQEPTKQTEVLGAKATKRGYLIRFKSEEAKQLATQNQGWTAALGKDTKINRPKFGVVVHRTPTAEVKIEEKEKAIQKITQENKPPDVNIQIEEIAWMKKKDTPLGHYASLGIWFNTAEAAQNAVQNGLLFGQEIVNRVEFYRMERKRCYRCQSFGHLAWNCKEKERCGNCNKEHNTKNCPPGSSPQCADCRGSHPTGDSQCRAQILPHISFQC